MTCSISNAQASCGSAPITVSATAADQCNGSLKTQCACPANCSGCTVNADGSVTLAVTGVNNGKVVYCNATDASGNTGTCSETINIVQTAGTYPC
jgi:hypothetical protein